MTTIFEIDPIKYERDMLLMLVLDEDEFGPGAFDRAVEKLRTANDVTSRALRACEAFIKWERSSLEHGKPRDTRMLVDAMVLCHRAVMEAKQ